jgi:hypothetical protein
VRPDHRHVSKKAREISRNIKKINDLRESALTLAFVFDRSQQKRGEKMPSPQRNALNAKKETAFFVLFSFGQSSPIRQAANVPFVAHSFPTFRAAPPLQNVKEQAPKRRSFPHYHV